MQISVMDTPCCTSPHLGHAFPVVHPTASFRVWMMSCPGVTVEEALKL